ncbi:MAG: histidine kinase, partial [Cyanobacteria bacterium RYN_339]|nr:histidine kinase [Cyanobacteria bacterium RYN_339]
YEEIVADPFGNRVYLSTKFAVHTEEGAIDVIGGVSTDITERKRLEELMREQFDQLKALDLLKGEFVNAVSHDLRTPLTSILGYAEFLEDGIGGLLAGQQLEFVSHIQKAAQRLERLVDDLLDFARIEAGTFTLRQEQAELGELVAEIVASLRPQAEEAHLHLTLDLPAEPLRLAVDFRRIQQVITNLLHNAIKFTPPGGTVAFRAIPSGAMLRCEVSDTGPGIAEEDIPRLFQRFAQLREGRAKGGTGLGLSISKAIVEAHGGEIGVISQPGAGATFWFTLPVASMDLPQPPPA